jgi:hypothetical protein
MAVYSHMVVKAVDIREHGMTRPEVCEEPNRLGVRTRKGTPWCHPAQIIKLLWSFNGDR